MSVVWKRIGKGGFSWKRRQMIGKGGYGRVYLGTSSDVSPSTFAVKSAEVSRSQSLWEEIQVLRQLQDCSNIITCFGIDFTVERGKIISNILLEYARAGTLADRLGRFNSGRGLEEYEVKKYAKSILLGLRDVHNRGFIHCDIKPSNVLLVAHADTGKVTAKIADFGFALHQSQYKTTNGRLRGTPLYIAPEVVLDDKYGPEADIWSFGCTVFEIITGKPLWELDEDIYVLCRISIESPDLQNSKLSRLAEDFLRKCLVRDHRARWTAA
ncbi:hypothetical protein KY284_002619 [Solanum tuberosum]|nr:hypothetical protein KY284_002619 [Solanum tuberosum]